jgi:hypothetical protein
MFEAGLVHLLTSDSGVSALISNRLYATQGAVDSPTYPYAVYHSIPVARSEYTFDGKELRARTIQFDVWGTDPADCANTLLAIRNVLSGYTGTLNDGTRVLFAARANELSNFDVDQRTFRSVVDYEFQFVEP